MRRPRRGFLATKSAAVAFLQLIICMRIDEKRQCTLCGEWLARAAFVYGSKKKRTHCRECSVKGTRIYRYRGWREMLRWQKQMRAKLKAEKDLIKGEEDGGENCGAN